MATLYYKIAYSGPQRGSGDPNAKLFIGDIEVTRRYDNGHSTLLPPAGNIYFEKTIVLATYSKPFDYETATVDIDHHEHDHPPARVWSSISVPNDFVIPWEFTPDLLPGIFTRTPDGDGFTDDGYTLPGLKNLPGAIWDGISSTVLRFGPGRGLENIQKALDNAQVVRDTVEETLNKGLDLLDGGFRMISDPDADPAEYDAAVNKYLDNTLRNHLKALEDVQTFDDPDAERAFDTIVNGVGVIVSLDSGIPGGEDARYSIEVQTSANPQVADQTLRGRDGADVILAGAGGSRMDGGQGNDILIGGGGGDSAHGGFGSDRIYTGGGDDFIELNPGSWSFGDLDFIDGGTGNDVLDLGFIADPHRLFSLSIASGQVFIESSGHLWATFRNIEAFRFANDWIVQGSDLGETISGGYRMIVNAGGGDDVVRGVDGQFDGSFGQDLFWFIVAVDQQQGERATIDLFSKTVTGPRDSYSLVLTGFEEFSAGYEIVDWLGTSADEVFHVSDGQTVDGRGGADTIVTRGDADLAAGRGSDSAFTFEFTFTGIVNLRGSSPGDNDWIAANSLAGNGEANILSGEGGDDVLNGRGGNDTLRGGTGNDILDGGTGSDELDGGAGDDIYHIDEAGDTIVEAAGGGNDTVRSAIDYTLAAGLEIEHLRTDDDAGSAAINLFGNELAQEIVGNDGVNVLSGDAGNDMLSGLAGDDTVYGGDGNDTLDGGIGGDYLEGGANDDTYMVDDARDVVVEAIGGGYDIVVSLFGYTLAADAEVEELRADPFSGDSVVKLTGNRFSQTITGNAGANTLSGENGDDILVGDDGDDVLIGGIGSDILLGGADNDTYVVTDAFDVVIEAVGQGNDTVRSSVNYVLQAGVSIEQLRTTLDTGTTSIQLTGNAFAQTITGNAGANMLNDGSGAAADTLRGLAGNDVYVIHNSSAVVIEATGQGSDTVLTSVSYALKAGVEVETLGTTAVTGTSAIDLAGNAFAQTITGNAGANVLSDGGGAGVDTLQGLGGNDIYRIANSRAIIVEAAGKGSDTVLTSVSYALKAGVEVETLGTTDAAGTASIQLTGNAFAQTITGNAGANMLNDGSSLAADTLSGLGGNDVYVIHNAGAVIVEAAGQGSDSVLTSVSYALKAGVEVEALGTTSASGTGAINLTGNAFAQKITGNAGANTLNDGSGAAADTLSGLDGNDIYVIHNAGAVIIEAGGKGTDSVLSSVSFVLQNGISVETLGTTNAAGTGAIDLTGNSIGQTVRGNAGSNVIDGKGGADTLTGFGGKDFFVFSSAIGASSDTVTDFNVADDTIRLENAIFTKLEATGVLNSGLFRSNSTGTAVDGNDYVLYDNTDGKLYYDADGSGAGTKIHFATLTGAPAISNLDFVVI